MAAPIPSFFKIRLVLIIIGFLVMFFVIGVVRSVFAYTYPGKCGAEIQFTESGCYTYDTPQTNVYSTWTVSYTHLTLPTKRIV